MREKIWRKNTSVSADRKTGIITIQVADKSPTRAAAMAGEYINELNQVVTLLNTSSAHRERVFLEDRLTQVKQDLESAEQNFSQFATKNTALDIPTQGKAMIEAAATLEGQLIAAQTELEGLKQVYADGNVRVRSTQARVDELRRQLEKSLGSKSGDPGTGNGQEPAFALSIDTRASRARRQLCRPVPKYQDPRGSISDADPAIRTREGAGGKGNTERQSSRSP